jgi:hypothetical protein
MRIPRLKLKILVLALVAVAGATATVSLAAPNRAADNRADVQKALTKTANVKSGQFAFTFKLTGAANGAGNDVSVTGAGAFDTKHKVAAFTVNLGVLAQLLGGATGGVQIPQKLDVVAVNNTVYVRLPSAAAQIKPGAQWLKFDSASVQGSLPKGVKPPATTTTDPKQALKVLNSSIAVHKVGSTTVRGSSTTHYVATVNVTKVVNGLVPAKDRASTLKSLNSAGIKTLNFDVYVDKSGLVRRVSGGLKGLKVDKGTPALSILLSVDLYGFGHPVKASAPPASKTADGSKLLAQLGGTLGGSGGSGG